MFTIHGVYLYPVKHPQIHIWTLWFLFRASRAAADKCWLRLSLSCGCRFVPCCVESTAEALSLQVIISTLGCVLRDEPNTFSRLALRPPGWPTCGDVNTHSSVSQKDAIRSVEWGGGASNYLSRNWKWGEMPAVVSTHISTQETDGRTPSPSRLSFPYTHLHAELKLIYALVQWTLKSLLVLGVWICVCALAGSSLSYMWMSQTDACVAPKKDRQNWQKLSLTLVRPCVTGSTFSLHSLIRSWNVGPHGRKHSKMFLRRERVGG